MTHPMSLDSGEKLERLRSFFTEHPELAVTSAYLFGSHAAGRAHREAMSTWACS